MLKYVRPTLLGLLMAGIMPIIGTSPAMADSIDFTDGSWNGAQGQTSYTANEVTLSSVGGTMTVNPGDGIGIGDDEITQGGVEQFTITFNGPVTLRGGSGCLDRFCPFISGAGPYAPTRPWAGQAGCPSTRDRACVRQARDAA